jgi:hypothetical protein
MNENNARQDHSHIIKKEEKEGGGGGGVGQL